MIRIIISLLLFVSPLVQARDWVEYTSKHFLIQSDVKPKKVVGFLEDLEAFHSVVTLVTGIEIPDDEPPAVLVMFNSRKDFRALGTPPNIAGIYRHFEHGPRMVVAPNGLGAF